MSTLRKRILAFAAVIAIGAPCVFAVPARAAETPSEKLTKEVRRELVRLPYFGVFDNLAYRSKARS
jgi:hypothetical protein